ncbi:YaiI/YqxD family protein [Pseudobacteriovorax antillogorgiicola]|uniref:UPF0178 protein SAMN06296036_11936 n=1 Tax=Pseudobacteriovorax antillogorgiicola TaxID=1513793 RepID=A0A1Y6CLB4_9BACT|nr:YaiI/YqxD family protein [Pseudobacteriovorax antillogorgiicola]TCS47924.1 hypothetical protein EDD56_11935 [Pseudobacteriovorax antillogorgiicola]SMF57944.1 hypothetical protein SAMN06296036_11936 [Pseudobacteriovorax antillogorgiicola]
MTRIWIDADACPAQVKEIVFKAMERTQTPVTMVANSQMRIPKSPLAALVVVDKGADVADAYIVENCKPIDLVITADIPLADLIVQKGAAAINPRGKVYTEASIKEALSMRNFMDDLRSTGMISGGPAPLGAKDIQAFANGFDKLLTQTLRR